MSVNPPNYRETVFQHQDLTKTSGNPTYKSLAHLERQCKANAQSVLSTIGNGNLGYLGLVSSALAYERSSPGVPFVRPILPVLPDLTNSTAAQITEAHRLFAEQTSTFNACNQIERTIIQQISTALDDDCLADLINEDTGHIQGTVPEIFLDLYRTFGAITPQTLAKAKADLEQTVYDHTKPLSNVFTAIARHADMATAAESEETTAQLINIGLIIITRPTVFANDIRNWHDRPAAQKTWPRFKTHFKDAQRAIIRSLPAVTADSLGYHDQANAASVANVVDQVIDRLQAQQNADSALTTDSAAEAMAEQQMTLQLANMANATQQSQTMFEQMQSLQSTIATLQNQVNSSHNNQGGGGGGGRGGRQGRGSRGGGRGAGQGGGRGGRRDGPSRTRGPPGYCWTHGNCSHTGSDCNDKAEGHIDTATYSNMQGGSTYKCSWL
jgi:uncharacterized membrane protein YgcG